MPRSQGPRAGGRSRKGGSSCGTSCARRKAARRGEQSARDIGQRGIGNRRGRLVDVASIVVGERRGTALATLGSRPRFGLERAKREPERANGGAVGAEPRRQLGGTQRELVQPRRVVDDHVQTAVRERLRASAAGHVGADEPRPGTTYVIFGKPIGELRDRAHEHVGDGARRSVLHLLGYSTPPTACQIDCFLTDLYSGRTHGKTASRRDDRADDRRPRLRRRRGRTRRWLRRLRARWTPG